MLSPSVIRNGQAHGYNPSTSKTADIHENARTLLFPLAPKSDTTKLLVAFSSTDPGRNNSGSKESSKGRTSKGDSPYLHKALFLIMSILFQLNPTDDPVYEFLDKKRFEGKLFYVYITLSNAKFLRICYGRVRDCPKEVGLWDESVVD